MKNKEKFAKEIVEIACSGSKLALCNGEIRVCKDLTCSECEFCGKGVACDLKRKAWAESEYVEPKYEIDWASVPVDTPVLLKEKDNVDNKRYFYKTLSEGTLALFINGRTSWSSIAEAGGIKCCFHSKSNVTLAREEDKLKYRKRVE